MTLEDLADALKQNISMHHAGDCLEILEHGDCTFESFPPLEYEQVLELYKTRLALVKENHATETDYIEDFENLISNLTQSKASQIGMASIIEDEDIFLIFHESESNHILGILSPLHEEGEEEQDVDNEHEEA